MMTDGQRYTLAAVAMAAAIGCYWGAVTACATGCTPAEGAAVESAATKVQPELQAGCKLAEDWLPGLPYLDLACTTAEDVDRLLQHLPGASVVGAIDAGASTAVRVRCPLKVAAGDAGGQ